LDPDLIEELLDRIDAERAGRHLVSGLALLPERDRAVVELVDIAGQPGPVWTDYAQDQDRGSREVLKATSKDATGGSKFSHRMNPSASGPPVRRSIPASSHSIEIGSA
jgi:hypothetical protein